MVTTSIAAPAAARSERAGRWRKHLSTGRAATLPAIGIIGAIGIVTLAALAVPLAAVIVFGPMLLALL